MSRELNRPRSSGGIGRRHLLALAAASPWLGPVSARAQGLQVAAVSFPTRVVRIVVPFPAGGSVDTLTRGLAAELTTAWNQPTIVENKPGAGTIIGADAVAKAVPDGYTLLLANPSLSAQEYLYRKLPYNGIQSFTPVFNLAASHTMLVASPKLNVATLQDFVSLAKAKPGMLTYATFGVGTSTHLEMERFSSLIGAKLVHVPYKGIAEVVPALMSGQVDVSLVAVQPVIEAVKAGKLIALGHAAPQRSAALPTVPTIAEAGVPFETDAWFGLLAPVGTPRPVVHRIAETVDKVVRRPEFDQRFIDGVGLELKPLFPDEFAQFLEADRRKWRELVRRANVKLD